MVSWGRSWYYSCFALEKAIAPLALVDQLPRAEPQLEDLKRRLEKNGNRLHFPIPRFSTNHGQTGVSLKFTTQKFSSSFLLSLSGLKGGWVFVT